MNNDCLKCGGKCCVGIIEVFSNDAIFYDETLVCECDEFLPDRVMMMGTDLKCIALKDGKCSIYEKRPTVCRQFEVGCSRCYNYKNGVVRIRAANI